MLLKRTRWARRFSVVSFDSYDEEIDSLTTSFGYFSGGLGIVLGIWAGRAVYLLKASAGFSERGWLTFWAWLFAMVVLVVLSAVFDLAFKQFRGAFAGYFRMLLELAAMVGVGWSCHQWWKGRMALLAANERSQEPP